MNLTENPKLFTHFYSRYNDILTIKTILFAVTVK